jgi:hypothetical protein
VLVGPLTTMVFDYLPDLALASARVQWPCAGCPERAEARTLVR